MTVRTNAAGGKAVRLGRLDQNQLLKALEAAKVILMSTLRRASRYAISTKSKTAGTCFSLPIWIQMRLKRS
jgi:hypothetical protein